ncbi:hypothetical protein PghCCS26_46470 [Paenibacillus glycanilyticus]|uniref:Transcriptional regulator n=1 Tax=Paenibacillus glycanilyticus TaxID=126569 RepID=A0ABQ6NQY9_9BACL|nr:hypothetical protein [Paenibacillus glycanilyticus]GMK47517.1 hypothetical protein PghCCS26_46470 [Paenibacillus glycanilyticus]
MRNIEITDKNVTLIPMDWLLIRYQKLNKKIKQPLVDAKILSEHAVIERYLADKGHFEQLELNLPRPKREEYVGVTEQMLKEYYRLQRRKERLEQEWEYLSKTCTPAETKITASYNGGGGGAGLISKPVEKAVLQPLDRLENIEREIYGISNRLAPMERALQALDYDQLRIITAKYFVTEKKKDQVLYEEELFLNRQKYYELKKTAIITIAQALRII